MIAAARDRLAGLANVEAQVGDLEELAFPAARFDTALLFNVLTEVERPERALAELARVLRPGGRLVVTVLDAHEHAEATAAFGHLHPGFAPPALRRLLGRAGLEVEECRVTSQEKRQPRFKVVTAWATRRRKAS
jgi:ArsR family transcriptional regulator